jgi:DNA (cytosine-5)-methyltransferase 1
MSWLYSQALVEEYLGENFSDGEPSAPLNGNPIQQAYCAPDKMTDFSRVSRFGMTFKPLTENRGEELLTSYLAAFHAKTSVPQEKALELTENGQECGEKWHASFTKYDLDSSSWKTHQCSLLGDLEPFLETWPQWGLMRNGECWEQRTLEQTIRGTESGLSEKWATPTTMDKLPPKSEQALHKEAKQVRLGRSKPANLRDQVSNMQNWQTLTANNAQPTKMMWLTPRVVEVDESPENFRARMNKKRPNDRKTGYGSLTMQVKWPTPDANCGTRGIQAEWSSIRESGQKAQYTINQAVRDKMFPTPTCHNSKEGAYPAEFNRKTPTLATHAGGKLNPTWVEWLMGWPLEWTDLKPLEMDKFHYVQQPPGEF